MWLAPEMDGGAEPMPLKISCRTIQPGVQLITIGKATAGLAWSTEKKVLHHTIPVKIVVYQPA